MILLKNYMDVQVNDWNFNYFLQNRKGFSNYLQVLYQIYDH